MKISKGYYENIISLENLLGAWQEFAVDKHSRKDVQQFQRDLMANIIELHRDLESGDYRHSAYSPFKISDPKPRNIHKASVRDRLLHRAIYRVLYPIWDKTFIYDSYSCRNNKGTHKAFTKLENVSRKISKNYTHPCFALKLDIRKFFDSIDHEILMGLLRERIEDKKLLELLENIIQSFSVCHAEFISRHSGEPLKATPESYNNQSIRSWTSQDDAESRGMPLGNLTSQLFANVYLDPLDKFAKHHLKAKHYLRYADDFVFLSDNPDELLGYLIEVNRFLKAKLKLNIHPNKIYLRKLNWGIDYVGYVALPHYAIPRKKTVKRIFKKLIYLKEYCPERIPVTMPSYLGYLRHADTHHLVCCLLQRFSE
ncbi:MAG: reverse transcriptase/maturase family protein [Patescibacteria group bacterium]|jgi:retron-type reverse transcriptase